MSKEDILYESMEYLSTNTLIKAIEVRFYHDLNFCPTEINRGNKKEREKIILLLGMNENMSQKFSAPYEQLQISLSHQKFVHPFYVFSFLSFFLGGWGVARQFLFSAPIGQQEIYKTELYTQCTNSACYGIHNKSKRKRPSGQRVPPMHSLHEKRVRSSSYPVMKLKLDIGDEEHISQLRKMIPQFQLRGLHGQHEVQLLQKVLSTHHPWFKFNSISVADSKQTII